MNADISRLKGIAEEVNNIGRFRAGEFVKLKDSVAKSCGLPETVTIYGCVSYVYNDAKQMCDVIVITPDGKADTFRLASWMIEHYEEDK